MRRRFSTRDAGLTVRMGVALLLVAVFYAGIVALLYGVTKMHGGWRLAGIAIAIVVLLFAVSHLVRAPKMLLERAGATPLVDGEEPALVELTAKLAALAGLRPPRLYVLETPEQNAFTIGVRSQTTGIAVTRGLLAALEPAELEAVIAHELSHVANRDSAVLTVASGPRVIGETLMGKYDNDDDASAFFLWFFVWWLGVPIWALGALLTLTISRYREFTADRGSAILTGRPETLMSALVKLDGHSIPADDLRAIGAAEAFCIVSPAATRFSWLADHPPLERRLARLEAMSREMGTPIGS